MGLKEAKVPSCIALDKDQVHERVSQGQVSHEGCYYEHDRDINDPESLPGA
jgi:hypothetical protein